MVSVLDLMILCLDVDSVEGLPNFGSAEANPADCSINVILDIVRNLARWPLGLWAWALGPGPSAGRPWVRGL